MEHPKQYGSTGSDKYSSGGDIQVDDDGDEKHDDDVGERDGKHEHHESIENNIPKTKEWIPRSRYKRKIIQLKKTEHLCSFQLFKISVDSTYGKCS